MKIVINNNDEFSKVDGSNEIIKNQQNKNIQKIIKSKI